VVTVAEQERAKSDLLPSFDPAPPRQPAFNGFGPAPIPDPRDKVMDSYIGSVVADGPTAVASITSSASEAGRRVLRAHAERLASRAVRTRCPRLLVPAVVAAVLGGLDQNAWEAMMPMALIDDAGRRLGLDLSDLFEEAARIVGHPGTVNLMVWLTRPAEKRTPEAMGFAPSSDEGGFRYRWSA
jgi:hypothetical protein